MTAHKKAKMTLANLRKLVVEQIEQIDRGTCDGKNTGVFSDKTTAIDGLIAVRRAIDGDIDNIRQLR